MSRSLSWADFARAAANADALAVNGSLTGPLRKTPAGHELIYFKAPYTSPGEDLGGSVYIMDHPELELLIDDSDAWAVLTGFVYETPMRGCVDPFRPSTERTSAFVKHNLYVRFLQVAGFAELAAAPVRDGWGPVDCDAHAEGIRETRDLKQTLFGDCGPEGMTDTEREFFGEDD